MMKLCRRNVLPFFSFFLFSFFFKQLLACVVSAQTFDLSFWFALLTTYQLETTYGRELFTSFLLKWEKWDVKICHVVHYYLLLTGLTGHGRSATWSTAICCWLGLTDHSECFVKNIFTCLTEVWIAN